MLAHETLGVGGVGIGADLLLGSTNLLSMASMEPKRDGKAGRYLSVLSWASLNGSSLLTWGRLWL